MGLVGRYELTEGSEYYLPWTCQMMSSRLLNCSRASLPILAHSQHCRSKCSAVLKIAYDPVPITTVIETICVCRYTSCQLHGNTAPAQHREHLRMRSFALHILSLQVRNGVAATLFGPCHTFCVIPKYQRLCRKTLSCYPRQSEDSIVSIRKHNFTKYVSKPVQLHKSLPKMLYVLVHCVCHYRPKGETIRAMRGCALLVLALKDQQSPVTRTAGPAAERSKKISLPIVQRPMKSPLRAARIARLT